MKLSTCGFILIWFYSASFSNEYLISIENLPRSEWLHYRVIKVINNTYLILATENSLNELNRKRISYSTLDTDPLQRKEVDYFIVYPFAESKIDIMKTAHILFEQEYFFVVRVKKTDKDAFLHLRVERDYISFRKYHFSTKPIDKSKVPNVTYQSIIQNAVDLVSKDSLRSYVKTLEEFDSRKMRDNQNAIEWIVKKFKEFGADSVFIEEVPSFTGNVVGIVKGVDHKPNHYCLIGGHMDAVVSGPPAAGADDNASGTAAVIEACRVLQKFSLKNTVYFVTFDAEEVGKLGSSFYAQNARDRGDNIIGGCINLDMIGYSKSNPTLWIHYKTSIAGNEELATTFENCAKTYVSDLTVKLVTSSGIMSASDHSSFWENKYPAFLGIETKEKADLCPNYHKPGDLLDDPGGLNDSELMTNSTKAAVATLATYAVPNGTSIQSTILKKNYQSPLRIMTNGTQHTYVLFTISNNNVQTKVRIYDIHGKTKLILLDCSYNFGTYTIPWPKSFAAKGIYVVELQMNNSVYANRYIHR